MKRRDFITLLGGAATWLLAVRVHDFNGREVLAARVKVFDWPVVELPVDGADTAVP